MSTTPAEFIATSEKNLANASNESDYRCSITRAYYGSFNAALGFHSSLSVPGISAPAGEGGVHENLIHQLKHPQVPTADQEYLASKELSKYLFKMRYQRIQSDYHLDKDVTKTNADTTLAEAKMVLQTIDSL